MAESMLSEEAKGTLEKQKYRVVGSHSAVKVCGWTKNMIRGRGGCYKLTFYGIMSHQCMQMTPSVSCANRCSFCWRGYKAPVAKDWEWQTDEPDKILEESEAAHHKLLTGMHGWEHNVKVYEGSKTVKHVALSLTGEPITYPKINELIQKFHKKNISTFLVTNAQYPEAIKNLQQVTQLYVSVDAPNKELLKKVDVPLFDDYWERLVQSLDYLRGRKERTCIRLTLMKDINTVNLDGYKELIERGDPDFIEIKGFMYVGEAEKFLSRANVPLHEEVVIFSKKLEKLLEDYAIVTEHIASRVVMLAKKKFLRESEWYTWIDFPRFLQAAQAGKEIAATEYLLKTPQVGLSGKGTLDRKDKRFRHAVQKPHKVDTSIGDA